MSTLSFGRFFLVLWTISLLGCQPHVRPPRPQLIHHYELRIVDISGRPIPNATVTYDVRDHNLYVKRDVVSNIDKEGVLSITVIATPDPSYESVTFYSTEIRYEVVAPGYDRHSGSLSSRAGEKSPTVEFTKKATAVLVRPRDYIKPEYDIPKNEEIIRRVMASLETLLTRSYLSDCYLQTHSVGVAGFKGKEYLELSFRSIVVYNDLKLNKYDIGKRLFDELIRKVLSPLNEQFADSKSLFGYDLSVIGYSKDFGIKTSSSDETTYRFLLPRDVVAKYKNKDLTGQQLLDASYILMDDERIDLKLQ